MPIPLFLWVKEMPLDNGTILHILFNNHAKAYCFAIAATYQHVKNAATLGNVKNVKK